MIYGVVNFRREATLPLVVGNSTGQREVIAAVIDTGFDGFLSLPSEKIIRLGLPWRTSNTATLGDGSEVLFDFYTATVIWDGQYHEIDIAASETEPLLVGHLARTLPFLKRLVAIRMPHLAIGEWQQP